MGNSNKRHTEPNDRGAWACFKDDTVWVNLGGPGLNERRRRREVPGGYVGGGGWPHPYQVQISRQGSKRTPPGPRLTPVETPHGTRPGHRPQRNRRWQRCVGRRCGAGVAKPSHPTAHPSKIRTIPLPIYPTPLNHPPLCPSTTPLPLYPSHLSPGCGPSDHRARTVIPGIWPLVGSGGVCWQWFEDVRKACSLL